MRKVVTTLALAVTMACLLASPAHADNPIGGARLAGRGYIWDRASRTAEPPHIEASSYVIADLETGQVLAAKNPHGHYRPASTLKTLTSIALIPRLDPASKVRPSVAAVDASGSAVGLEVTWTYTVKDLFHGLLMQSGNDAAIALAEANGGMPATLAAMNAEARRIQALDTVAATPNGLDDDPPLTLQQQHSSAYDLALIMKQGLRLPDFRTYVAAKLYDWPAPPTKEERKKGKKTGGYQIGTHDHLLVPNHYPGMIGGKNGWTSHALGSFVGAATRGGHTIVISLMHAQSDFWGDARSLLDWGFAERSKVQPVGTLMDPVPPPVKPKPKTAGKPAAAVGASPSGELAWWKIGLPAGVAVAVLAGLAIGLRRRRPAAAGSTPAGSVGAPVPGDAPHFVPPDSDAGAETGTPPPPPRRSPPGDLKVAGSPLAPAGQSPPSPRQTAPHPVQPPSEAEHTQTDAAPEPGQDAAETAGDTRDRHRDTEQAFVDAPDWPQDTPHPQREATGTDWTVRLPTGSEPEDDVTPDPWRLSQPSAGRERPERDPFETAERPGTGEEGTDRAEASAPEDSAGAPGDERRGDETTHP
jgi:D-alanyl-D-alanine carboxypeptidase (penicillin-binding protein 5/6)